jgi:tryptophan-rich sensory protein
MRFVSAPICSSPLINRVLKSDAMMREFNRSAELIWDRPDGVGAAATAAIFAGAAIALNGIIFAFGLAGSDDAVSRLSWAPPGWAIGAIWVVLFMLYAVAHWLLRQHGDSGRRAARWVLAIVVWDLAYPFLTLGFDLTLGAWLNVVTLLLTIVLLWRVWHESRPAFAWLLPSLAWVGFATVLTFAALQ